MQDLWWNTWCLLWLSFGFKSDLGQQRSLFNVLYMRLVLCGPFNGERSTHYTCAKCVGHYTIKFRWLQKGMAPALFWNTAELWFSDTDFCQVCWFTYKNTTCFTLCISCQCASKARVSDVGIRSHSHRGAAIQSVLGKEGTINFKKISRKKLDNVVEENSCRNHFWLVPFFKDLLKKKRSHLKSGRLPPLEQ